MMTNETLAVLGFMHNQEEFHIPGNEEIFSLLKHAEGIKAVVDKLRATAAPNTEAIIELTNYMTMVEMVATNLAVLTIVPPTTKIMKQIAARRPVQDGNGNGLSPL